MSDSFTVKKISVAAEGDIDNWVTITINDSDEIEFELKGATYYVEDKEHCGNVSHCINKESLQELKKFIDYVLNE